MHLVVPLSWISIESSLDKQNASCFLILLLVVYMLLFLPQPQIYSCCRLLLYMILWPVYTTRLHLFASYKLNYIIFPSWSLNFFAVSYLHIALLQTCGRFGASLFPLHLFYNDKASFKLDSNTIRLHFVVFKVTSIV
jgi:hypothetical protein